MKKLTTPAQIRTVKVKPVNSETAEEVIENAFLEKSKDWANCFCVDCWKWLDHSGVTTLIGAKIEKLERTYTRRTSICTQLWHTFIHRYENNKLRCYLSHDWENEIILGSTADDPEFVSIEKTLAQRQKG